MQQRAVERCFGIIGEALNRLHKISPELVERIPDARMIISFRNKLVHDYDHIATVTVWKATMNGLPQLHDTVRELLTELDLAGQPAGDNAAEPDNSPEPF